MRPLAAKLHEEAQCKTLILKLGDRGVLTCRMRQGGRSARFFVVDSFAERVVDAVGAGDALLGLRDACRCSSTAEVAASVLGSIAAAVECEDEGNIPVGPEDVLRQARGVEKRVALRIMAGPAS